MPTTTRQQEHGLQRHAAAAHDRGQQAGLAGTDRADDGCQRTRFEGTGKVVNHAGYVVPLEEADSGLNAFLLVPYFGACIHTPAPPANQIVFVSARGAKGLHAMDTVWVSGKLSTSRQNSPMGFSGYRLESSVVERYVRPGS